MKDNSTYIAALAHFKDVGATPAYVADWLAVLKTDLLGYEGTLDNLTAYVSAAADYLKSLEA